VHFLVAADYAREAKNVGRTTAAAAGRRKERQTEKGIQKKKRQDVLALFYLNIGYQESQSASRSKLLQPERGTIIGSRIAM